MKSCHAALAVLVLAAASAAPAAALETSLGPLVVERMATGLDEPWGLAFLPDGSFLVTGRDGVLTLFPEGGGDPLAEVGGLPEVAATGQGGLLDVLVPRDFGTTREILLSYAAPGAEGEVTAMGAGRLSQDGTRLEGFRQLFAMVPGSSGGRHFGSRLVEAPDGTIFLTIGDRGDDRLAQDLTRHEGAVVHLTRNGAPAGAAPFGAGALPDLHSKGHRNAQGAALDDQGRLWVVEHGARGGDEVNLVAPGANYGWPVISYGRGYDGSTIGTGTEAPGMEQPLHFWDPSIAPSGLMIYGGDLFPDWRGDFFTGSLNSDFIARLDPDRAWSEERLAAPQTGRVRDVREGPEGAIWFLSVTDGTVYRVLPAP